MYPPGSDVGRDRLPVGKVVAAKDRVGPSQQGGIGEEEFSGSRGTRSYRESKAGRKVPGVRPGNQYFGKVALAVAISVFIAVRDTIIIAV